MGSCFAGCLDGSGKKGGPETGPNPTDRGRPGTKYHLLVDQNGIPLSVEMTAANLHEGQRFLPMLDSVPPIRRPRGRPRRRPKKLHADKAYEDRAHRIASRVRGITPRIARKEASSRARASIAIDGLSSGRSRGFIGFGASSCGTSGGRTLTVAS